MVQLSRDALHDISALVDFYEAKGRQEAVRNLRRAVARAIERIDRSPETGLTAPRPYPGVARPGVLWLKEGSYWIAYAEAGGPAIIAVMHDQANIPRRL